MTHRHHLWSPIGVVESVQRALLIAVTVVRDSTVAADTIDLIVGSRFRALVPQPSPSGASPSGKSLTTLAESDGGITGSASGRSDAGAFAGPLSPADKAHHILAFLPGGQSRQPALARLNAMKARCQSRAGSVRPGSDKRGGWLWQIRCR